MIVLFILVILAILIMLAGIVIIPIGSIIIAEQESNWGIQAKEHLVSKYSKEFEYIKEWADYNCYVYEYKINDSSNSEDVVYVTRFRDEDTGHYDYRDNYFEYILEEHCSDLYKQSGLLSGHDFKIINSLGTGAYPNHLNIGFTYDEVNECGYVKPTINIYIKYEDSMDADYMSNLGDNLVNYLSKYLLNYSTRVYIIDEELYSGLNYQNDIDVMIASHVTTDSNRIHVRYSIDAGYSDGEMIIYSIN